MRLILARLVWNFDLKLADESRGWAEASKVFLLWEKGPLMVHLTPRRTISVAKTSLTVIREDITEAAHIERAPEDSVSVDESQVQRSQE